MANTLNLEHIRTHISYVCANTSIVTVAVTVTVFAVTSLTAPFSFIYCWPWAGEIAK